MSDLSLFLDGFMKYFVTYFVFIAVIIVAFLIGFGLRKSKNAKDGTGAQNDAAPEE